MVNNNITAADFDLPENETVILWVLDVKTTHYNNPDCPMRIASLPHGGYYCVDCGCQIIAKKIRANVEII